MFPNTIYRFQNTNQFSIERVGFGRNYRCGAECIMSYKPRRTLSEHCISYTLSLKSFSGYDSHHAPSAVPGHLERPRT